MRARYCKVCDHNVTGQDTCTNGCCLPCHARFCAASGVSTKEHAIDLKTARRLVRGEHPWRLAYGRWS